VIRTPVYLRTEVGVRVSDDAVRPQMRKCNVRRVRGKSSLSRAVEAGLQAFVEALARRAELQSARSTTSGHASSPRITHARITTRYGKIRRPGKPHLATFVVLAPTSANARIDARTVLDFERSAK